MVLQRVYGREAKPFGGAGLLIRKAGPFNGLVFGHKADCAWERGCLSADKRNSTNRSSKSEGGDQFSISLLAMGMVMKA